MIRIKPVLKGKGVKYPDFIIPAFVNNNDSTKYWEEHEIHSCFYPFSRLPQPWNLYEITKTGIAICILLPIRLFFLITMAIFVTIFVTISSLVYYPSSVQDLSQPLPFCQIITLFIIRICSRISMFTTWGVFPDIQYLSYADMKEMYDYEPPESIHETHFRNASIRNHIETPAIASNHLGFLDIVYFMGYCNGSFLSKEAIRNVPLIGATAMTLQCLFITKHKSCSDQLTDRLFYNQEFHNKNDCNGCSLCGSNLVIFPEGTTTNGKAMIIFRRGLFNAGLPITPIVVKCPWTQLNTNWDSIYFHKLLFRTLTQFVNRMEVKIGPPYIPNDEEIENSALYAYNVNILMARMLNIDSIYLLNRKTKVCYQKLLTGHMEAQPMMKSVPPFWNNDPLFPIYLQLMRDDPRYQAHIPAKFLTGLKQNNSNLLEQKRGKPCKS